MASKTPKVDRFAQSEAESLKWFHENRPSTYPRATQSTEYKLSPRDQDLGGYGTLEEGGFD